jgi:hypothetical protein
MMTWKVYGMERPWSLERYYPSIRLKVLKKTTKILYNLDQRFSTGVPREFGGSSKRSEKKKSSKCMFNIIFNNNTMIRILAIELLNTILLLFS